MMNDISTSESAKILIVDDDPDISIALADLLIHEGYCVELASTGIEAVDRVKSQRFDVVLLDIRLPDLDGRAALQRLVQLDPHLPVILHTAQVVEDQSGSCLERDGAFAYLTKPFNRQELKATVRRAIIFASQNTSICLPC